MSGLHPPDRKRPSVTVGPSEVADVARDIQESSTPVRRAISGPGGFGKSTLLDELDAALRAQGVAVSRGLENGGLTSVGSERIALLVDDAERLSDADLARLVTIARNGGPHIVAAFRPWPRSGTLTELTDHLGKQRPPIVLRPLSAAAVRARAETVLGDVPDDLVDRVLRLTRGNPRLVDLIVVAAHDEQWDVRESAALPSMVLDHIRDELDRLDENLVEFLLALAVGFSVSGPSFGTAPRFAQSDVRALVAGARATGLVSSDGSLLPIVRAAVLENTLEPDLWSMRREFVDAMEAAGLPLGEAAVEFARLGYRDPRVADALQRRADENLLTDPVQAWRLYSAAIQAGADEAFIGGRRAQAAWAAGDVRAAERLVDGLLARAEYSDLPRVMNVAAAVWARKGILGRSADAYLKNAGAAEAWAAPLASISLAGIGDVERARTILGAAAIVDYPTSSHVAVTLMAEGVLNALDGETDRALSSLLQASSVMSESGETVPLPETPAILAAQVALNTGELGIASGVLQSATDASEGGPAFRGRLRLMEALVALRADRPLRARSLLAAVESSQQRLGLRDEVLAHAIRVGLARHTDDTASLVRAWNASRQTIARMPIDLYSLPALAELSIGAARLHESHLLAAQVAAAWKLLARAGEPATWSTSLRWSAIQAALLSKDSDAFSRHETALHSAASGCRVAGQLARAGRVWAAALAGDVDVDMVERAVHELAAAGYPWDASRLAGHAAARAPEHKDTLHLLAVARGLHPEEAHGDRPDEPTGDAPNSQQDDRRLSAREREVARLVLEGKTYAEIGTAIFISPRTAEHHIARIRRRLGVTTRSELLAELRLALDDGNQRHHDDQGGRGDSGQ